MLIRYLFILSDEDKVEVVGAAGYACVGGARDIQPVNLLFSLDPGDALLVCPGDMGANFVSRLVDPRAYVLRNPRSCRGIHVHRTVREHAGQVCVVFLCEPNGDSQSCVRCFSAVVCDEQVLDCNRLTSYPPNKF